MSHERIFDLCLYKLSLIYQSCKPIWGRTKDTDEHMGWIFPVSNDEEPGAEPDTLNGAKSVRELYEIASSTYSGKFTVPVKFASASKDYIFKYSTIWMA